MKHFAYESPFTMKDSEGNKYTLEIIQDEIAESPRNWDNVCEMICFHDQYSLGDKHNYDNPDEFFGLRHLASMTVIWTKYSFLASLIILFIVYLF